MRFSILTPSCTRSTESGCAFGAYSALSSARETVLALLRFSDELLTRKIHMYRGKIAKQIFDWR